MTNHEYEKQLKNLNEKKDKFQKQGKFVQVVKVEKEIRELGKRAIMTAEYERDKLADCIRNKPQEVQDEFEYQVCLFNVLVDMLDMVAQEINDNLEKYTEFRQLALMDDIRYIKRRIGTLLKVLDYNCNEETSSDYGDLSDRLLPALRQKVQEHIAWISLERKKEIAYARD